MNIATFLAACQAGDLTTVEQGLPGMDLAQTDKQGNTALILAVFEGRTDVVNALLPGSNANHQNLYGETALTTALYKQRYALVPQLIPVTDLHQRPVGGKTPLMLAAGAPKEVVLALLAGGSDPHATDSLGWTALMFAAYRGHLAAVQALMPVSLLDHVEHPLSHTEHRRTAYDAAVEEQNWAVVDAIAAHDLQDDRGWPKKATLHDLPQWHRRLEQRALAAVVEEPSLAGLDPQTFPLRPRLRL